VNHAGFFLAEDGDAITSSGTRLAALFLPEREAKPNRGLARADCILEAERNANDPGPEVMKIRRGWENR
jgi:hypothetical protein